MSAESPDQVRNRSQHRAQGHGTKYVRAEVATRKKSHTHTHTHTTDTQHTETETETETTDLPTRSEVTAFEQPGQTHEMAAPPASCGPNACQS